MAAAPAPAPRPAFDSGHLLSLCSGLGGVRDLPGGGSAYVRDDDALDCLIDLQRFLRRDEPATRDCVRQLADWATLRGHIIPLMCTYASNFDILFNATKVVVFMTLPTEPDASNPGEQLRALQRSKAMFLEVPAALTAALQLLAEPLARFAERGRMGEEDWKVTQLVLTLLRNLLAIPDPAPTAASGGDHLTRQRDELLQRLFREDVAELLLAVTQDAARLPFRNEAALLLEIFHELFRGVSPEGLFGAAERHAATLAAVRDGAAPAHAARKDLEAAAALRAVLGSERAAAKASARAGGGAPRHSRFGGTYVKPLPGGGGAAFVHSNPEAAPAAPPQRGRGAGGRGKPRLVGHQRTLAEDPGSAAAAAAAAAAPGAAQRGGAAGWTASTATQTQLKEFAETFLAGPYNALMGVLISDLLVGRAPGLSEHEIEQRTLHFMNVATFATAFVRVANARKAAAAAAAKAAAAAAAAEGGDAVDSAAAAAAAAAEEDDAPSPWAAIAETMDARAFHWVRTEWLRLCDLKGSEAGVAAAGALLKEMLAVLLAALTSAPADAQQPLSGAAAADRRVATALALQVLTDDTADEGILANLHKLVRGFDPRRFARSHMATLAAAVHTVLALLRALSEAADGALHVTRKRAKRTKKKAALPVDPDADAAADPDAAAANGGDAPAADAPAGDAPADGAAADGAAKEMDEDKAAALADAGIDMGDDDEGLEEDGPGGGGSGSDGEGTQRRRLREVRLDLPKRVARLVDAQTVCNYVWLLKHWRSNDGATNDVACAFLERLDSLSLAPMLYQLSVLTIIHDVLADPAARREPRHARLHAFCRRTTRGLFERMLPPLPPTPAAAAERAEAGSGSDSDAEAARAAAAAAEADAPGAAAARSRCAAGRMLCVDLLFWKQRTQALQLEIDFGRMSEDGPPGARPKPLCEDDETVNPEDLARYGPGGKAARKRRGLLSDEQADALKAMFEAHVDEPDEAFWTAMLQGMADAGAPLSRKQLATQLKGAGLRRKRGGGVAPPPEPGAEGQPREPRSGPPGGISRVARREQHRRRLGDWSDDDDAEDPEDTMEARVARAAEAAAARKARKAEKRAARAAARGDGAEGAAASSSELDDSGDETPSEDDGGSDGGSDGDVKAAAAPASQPGGGARGVVQRKSKPAPLPSKRRASQAGGDAAPKRRRGAKAAAPQPPPQLSAAEQLRRLLADSSDEEEPDEEEPPAAARGLAAGDDRDSDGTADSDDERDDAPPPPPQQRAAAMDVDDDDAGAAAPARRRIVKRAAAPAEAAAPAAIALDEDSDGGGDAAPPRRARAALIDSDDE